MSVRDATHAGSWYTAHRKELDKQLAGWLTKAGASTADGDPLPIDGLRAIIAPHAGYTYSGPAAGYAYKCIQPEKIKRVFILGPSHHIHLSGCALSKCSEYATPLGNLTIDKSINAELTKTGHFQEMSLETDEHEHSIEMHLPYVYKVFENHMEDVTVIPILVGGLSEVKETIYGKLLAPYLDNPENLFIISSDFCHWGTRFDYTYYTDEHGNVTQSLHPKGQRHTHASSSTSSVVTGNQKIFESIRQLDHEGMARIEERSHRSFAQYLSRTHNTICGRHPIGVLLAAVEALGKEEHRIQFVHYAQSSSVLKTTESSVSYASAFLQRHE
ncbi:hypothetical protein CPB97_009194 [Podila verticillata]|nr:hypothetical protein CPB97_009194 [Podila verticillata]